MHIDHDDDDDDGDYRIAMLSVSTLPDDFSWLWVVAVDRGCGLWLWVAGCGLWLLSVMWILAV